MDRQLVRIYMPIFILQTVRSARRRTVREMLRHAIADFKKTHGKLENPTEEAVAALRLLIKQKKVAWNGNQYREIQPSRGWGD